jgi:tryptophanyl-tRNA synthetase
MWVCIAVAVVCVVVCVGVIVCSVPAVLTVKAAEFIGGLAAASGLFTAKNSSSKDAFDESIKMLEKMEADVEKIDEYLTDVDSQAGKEMKTTKKAKKLPIKLKDLKAAQDSERITINENLDEVCAELKKLEHKAYALKARGQKIKVVNYPKGNGCTIF